MEEEVNLIPLNEGGIQEGGQFVLKNLITSSDPSDTLVVVDSGFPGQLLQSDLQFNGCRVLIVFQSHFHLLIRP